MNIGTVVTVKFFAIPTYENDRRVWRRTGPENTQGYYVGYTFKQEGKYNLGTYSSSVIEPYDVEQAYLSDVVAIKLLRIKTSERANDRFAFPKDVEELK